MMVKTVNTIILMIMVSSLSLMPELSFCINVVFVCLVLCK